MSFDSAFERHDLLDVGSHRSAGQQFHDAIQVLASAATAAQDLEPPGEDGLEVQRYPASRGDATEYQSAIHGQRRDRLLERGGRNMLEDELDPLAPRQFADFLCHPLAGLDNGVGAYAQQCIADLWFPADGDDPSTHAAGKLHGGMAEPAVGPKDKHRLVGGQAAPPKHRRGRGIGQAEAGSRHPVDAARQRHGVARGDPGVLGVSAVDGGSHGTERLAQVVLAAQAMPASSARQDGRGEDALPDVAVGHSGSDGDDLAGEVGTGNAWKRHLEDVAFA